MMIILQRWYSACAIVSTVVQVSLGRTHFSDFRTHSTHCSLTASWLLRLYENPLTHDWIALFCRLSVANFTSKMVLVKQTWVVMIHVIMSMMNLTTMMTIMMPMSKVSLDYHKVTECVALRP